jgi:hypothetical protein
MSTPNWPALTMALLDDLDERAAQDAAHLARRSSTTYEHRFLKLAHDQVSRARQFLTEHPEAAQGMYHAIQAGSLGAFHHAKMGQGARVVKRIGGKTRGQQIATAAKKHDAHVLKEYRRWQQSYNLQDDYRSASGYIAKKLKLKLYTVQRALKRLGKSR